MDIVIVSWNVQAALKECLQSIKKYSSEIAVVVVDNASTDGTVEMLKCDFPDVHCIFNTSNVGFARACNQGAKRGVGELILFLNPDAILCSGSIEALESFFAEQPYVGIVGPKIINDDGTIQPSVRRFPALPAYLWELLKLERVLPSSFVRRNQYSAFRYDTLRAVDQVMGAALAIRRALFEKMNGFDERFFIWFEEVDLCYRAKALGWLIFFVPQALIIHQRAASFQQRSILWKYLRFGQSGATYFYLRHRYFSALLIVFLLVLYLPIVVILWLVGRRHRS
ncbi:MAG: glycosyltransferase family 2 protein [Patescibacteria group bacterium]